jgi:hypothetical protein
MQNNPIISQLYQLCKHPLASTPTIDNNALPDSSLQWKKHTNRTQRCTDEAAEKQQYNWLMDEQRVELKTYTRTTRHCYEHSPLAKFYTEHTIGSTNVSHQLIHYVACTHTSQATNQINISNHIIQHDGYTTHEGYRQQHGVKRVLHNKLHSRKEQWNRSESVHKLSPKYTYS